MTGTAILILVASVLGAEGGEVRIDAGRAAGLRVGDRGVVFYELKVRDESRRVEVGQGQLTSVAEVTATLRMAVAAEVRPGFRVEFTLSANRIAAPKPPPPSPELGELRQRLSEAEARVAELEAELESAAAESAATLSARVSADSSLSELRSQLAAALDEQERLESESAAALAAAEGRIALLSAELAAVSARLGFLERACAARSEIAAPPADVPAPDDEGAAPAPEDMARIDGGVYTIGRTVTLASFYNQTPRFSRRLEPFWIDLEPVESAAYRTWRGAASSTVSSRYQAGVTLAEAEAYCRAHDKRLPSEIEWEVAMTNAELARVPGLFEWTSSWYQPYPGNEHPEPDYGERFRVIRASNGDPYERRYMLPGARDSMVGFRCVR